MATRRTNICHVKDRVKIDCNLNSFASHISCSEDFPTIHQPFPPFSPNELNLMQRRLCPSRSLRHPTHPHEGYAVHLRMQQMIEPNMDPLVAWLR